MAAGTSTSVQHLRISRDERELRLRQRGHVVWLFGLSGSGKTTLATHLERGLFSAGLVTARLDGDEIRASLSQGLGFTEADRTENLRRAAEVAKLFAGTGVICICAFITPLRCQREMIRDIIGEKDLSLIYLSASYPACARRDPKGHYSAAAAHQLANFTGLDSVFERPPEPSRDSQVDTETLSVDACLGKLSRLLQGRLRTPEAGS